MLSDVGTVTEERRAKNEFCQFLLFLLFLD